MAEQTATRRIDYVQTTSVNIGAAGPLITQLPDEFVPFIHKTRIPLVNFPLTLIDANVGAGALLYTFPLGVIRFIGAMIKNFNETTTSTLASTLNPGVNLSVGIGSVQTTTQGSGTLATTEQDILSQFTAVSSATINVAGASVNAIGPTAAPQFNGLSSALKAYLNVGVPVGTDIDGDATVLLNGTVELSWMNLGAL